MATLEFILAKLSLLTVIHPLRVCWTERRSLPSRKRSSSVTKVTASLEVTKVTASLEVAQVTARSS